MARTRENDGIVGTIEHRMGNGKYLKASKTKAKITQRIRKVVRAENNIQRKPGIRLRRGQETMAERRRVGGNIDEKGSQMGQDKDK